MYSYETPKMEIVYFETEDIIATSGEEIPDWGDGTDED